MGEQSMGRMSEEGYRSTRVVTIHPRPQIKIFMLWKFFNKKDMIYSTQQTNINVHIKKEALHAPSRQAGFGYTYI
jgi:hypothetical protein